MAMVSRVITPFHADRAQDIRHPAFSRGQKPGRQRCGVRAVPAELSLSVVSAEIDARPLIACIVLAVFLMAVVANVPYPDRADEIEDSVREVDVGPGADGLGQTYPGFFGQAANVRR